MLPTTIESIEDYEWGEGHTSSLVASRYHPRRWGWLFPTSLLLIASTSTTPGPVSLGVTQSLLQVANLGVALRQRNVLLSYDLRLLLALDGNTLGRGSRSRRVRT